MCDTAAKPSWIRADFSLKRIERNSRLTLPRCKQAKSGLASGAWHDITPAAIASQKRIISTLESLLTVLGH
jgi:hypothetical protein